MVRAPPRPLFGALSATRSARLRTLGLACAVVRSDRAPRRIPGQRLHLHAFMHEAGSPPESHLRRWLLYVLPDVRLLRPLLLHWLPVLPCRCFGPEHLHVLPAAMCVRQTSNRPHLATNTPIRLTRSNCHQQAPRSASSSPRTLLSNLAAALVARAMSRRLLAALQMRWRWSAKPGSEARVYRRKSQASDLSDVFIRRHALCSLASRWRQTDARARGSSVSVFSLPKNDRVDHC
jgi:hypothetical protein